MKKMKASLLTLVVLLFGIFPLLLLLVWVERNMAIPGLGSYLMERGVGLPWIFIDGGLIASITANAALLSIFLIAQLVLAKMQFKLMALIDGGLSALILIGLWQPTGVILYQLIPSALAASLVSFFLFWTFLGIGWKTGKYPAFVGLACFATPMLSFDRLIFGIFAFALASLLQPRRK